MSVTFVSDSIVIICTALYSAMNRFGYDGESDSYVVPMNDGGCATFTPHRPFKRETETFDRGGGWDTPSDVRGKRWAHVVRFVEKNKCPTGYGLWGWLVPVGARAGVGLSTRRLGRGGGGGGRRRWSGESSGVPVRDEREYESDQRHAAAEHDDQGEHALLAGHRPSGAGQVGGHDGHAPRVNALHRPCCPRTVFGR